MHYDQYPSETAATLPEPPKNVVTTMADETKAGTTNKSPQEHQSTSQMNQHSHPSSHSNNGSDTTQDQPTSTGILHDASIPVATKFARLSEQHEHEHPSHSHSRSRDLAEGEVRRSSAADPKRSSVWSMDKEKKQRSKVKKLLDHHWVPEFLK